MRHGWVIAAALALAAPAAAQDGSEGGATRTPESAQRFLSEFASQTGFAAYSTLLERDGGLVSAKVSEPVYYEKDGSLAALNLLGPVTSWTALDRCRSRIEMASPHSINAASRLHKTPPTSVVAEIDWSRVVTTGVVRDPAPWNIPDESGRISTVSYFGASVGMRNGLAAAPYFLFQTKADAERVGFAFDFLRQECEPKSDTGF